MLQASGLRVGFDRVEILRGVDLTVADAEVVSLMGASGSGKSTLLACLAGLLPPWSGSVQFRGQDLAALSDRQRAELRLRDFGFVFQFGDLIAELTLLENVELPLRFGGVSRRTARLKAQESLALLDIAELADRRTFEVSGGELQRAAVARALVHEPALVFADEPTGALDADNGNAVLEAMLTAAKFRRAGVVLATHDERVAARAHRQLRVEGGVLSERTG